MTTAQLYLVVEATPGNAEHLAAVLPHRAVAAVLIAPASDTPLAAAAVRPLVECAQSNDVAALLLDDAELARALRADGVHLDTTKDIAARYELAREILGTRYIVGVNAGKSRHDAMTLAEAGADYIAFGAPATLRDQAAAVARRREMIAWWSDLFEIPCVALDVASPDTAAELATHGADFVACSLAGDDTPTTSAQRVATFIEQLPTITMEAQP